MAEGYGRSFARIGGRHGRLLNGIGTTAVRKNRHSNYSKSSCNVFCAVALLQAIACAGCTFSAIARYKQHWTNYMILICIKII